MKYRLGLDIGTNSIGWAVISSKVGDDGDEVFDRIECAGSRIIPMDAGTLGDFDRGNSISKTKDRTMHRGIRRMFERSKLRRERLHRVLSLMGFLPEHYAANLDRYGKFLDYGEPKLAWCADSSGKQVFLFRESFEEMLADFKNVQPELISGNRKIPYDWTLYYLRKKALTSKIRKEELAWILLNFNQKRGYFQLRGDEDVKDASKKEAYYALRVVRVEDSGEKRGSETWYNVILENGWIYRRSSKTPLDWEGKTREFIVTTELEEDGTEKKDKSGNVKRSFRSPKEDDWSLLMLKTESDIEASHKSVGEYIYDVLLHDPAQKVRGKLIRTIDRKYYRDELLRILAKQMEFYPELQNRNLYLKCIEELYPSNDAHRALIAGKDIKYLLVDDILFYQRPLKSKKSLVADCPYEQVGYTDPVSKEKKYEPLKCIAKSHPLFQEFRLWQFLSNLRIYQKEKNIGGKLQTDVDVTSDFLASEEDWVRLFDWLNNRKEIKQGDLLKCLGLKKTEADKFRWNYVEDKAYPCNETRASMVTRLKKAGIEADFLNREHEEALWHILYSVSVKEELRKALSSYAVRYGLDDRFVEVFADMPPYEKAYGAYSAKAVRKLLPLMRMGHYWDENAIDETTRERIEKILNGEVDDAIRMRVREKTASFTSVSSFRGLPLWLACYVVYDRHSESKNVGRWVSPADIDTFLRDFRQHSLRNPIVEQVVTETLRVVRDIWKQTGHIDAIHVELGREMKNPADKRKKMTSQMLENENTNLRVKAMLLDFMNPDLGIENVRPFSPSQQEILRIFEEGVWNSVGENEPDREEMLAILKKYSEVDAKKRPTSAEVRRYRLWLEQRYRSPYTGEVIPLSRLFTPAYEIEHVIPQSRYFDDSFSNKVVCESEVNKLKSNMLGYEFIQKHHGEKVQLSGGRVVEIFSVEEYECFVKEHYGASRTKMNKLLMEDIPDQFIERQLNDSRYISRYVTMLLSNIVREEGEQESVSKNMVVCTGGITDRLKKDWGINDVWNKIILPRFERLDAMGEETFIGRNSSGHPIPVMPLYLQKGFNKKRIDHRHHAMDAIVIACADRSIVNYLNNESASRNARVSRYDLQRLLCSKKVQDEAGNYRWLVNKPWDTFTQDVFEVLSGIIVSFKQNLRVINKTTNSYWRYGENGKKVLCKQTEGDSWAIRKQMHKDTVFGEVNLREIKTASLKEVLSNPDVVVDKSLKRKLKELLGLGYDEKAVKEYFQEKSDVWSDLNLKKIDIYRFSRETKDRYFASRKSLDDTFDYKKIESVTDSGIRKILLRHLKENGDDAKLAFSPEGIERMNENICSLNDGKNHKPIWSVRVFEKADKFAVGRLGNKQAKFVEAAKGTNLFFAVYESEVPDKKSGELVKKRSFSTLPLNLVIERQKQGLCSAPEDENGNLPAFVLSPNDLVYVPTESELRSGETVLSMDNDRIYKMVSCTGNQCFFVKHHVSSPIWDKHEYFSLNKMEKAITGEMIKDVCIPVKVDRLGNIIS